MKNRRSNGRLYISSGDHSESNNSVQGHGMDGLQEPSWTASETRGSLFGTTDLATAAQGSVTGSPTAQGSVTGSPTAQGSVTGSPTAAAQGSVTGSPTAAAQGSVTTGDPSPSPMMPWWSWLAIFIVVFMFFGGFDMFF